MSRGLAIVEVKCWYNRTSSTPDITMGNKRAYCEQHSFGCIISSMNLHEVSALAH
jgi:hypothetical protein